MHYMLQLLNAYMYTLYSTTLVISSQIARESVRRRISLRTESSATAVTATNYYS